MIRFCLSKIFKLKPAELDAWLRWVAEVSISVGVPLVLFQPKKFDELLLCLGFAGFMFALLWIKRMVLRLFEEAVRLYRVGLMRVNQGLKQGVEQLSLCFISGKKYSIELWSRGSLLSFALVERMVLRLFEEAVRLYRVGLMRVNQGLKQGVEQLSLCFISGKKYSIELWSRGSLLSFALVEYAVYLCTAYLVWRSDNKVLHHTIYVGIVAFSLFFLYEVVPPYDHPQACFTMRFFSRLEMWVCWACGRIVRWFTLSGF